MMRLPGWLWKPKQPDAYAVAVVVKRENNQIKVKWVKAVCFTRPADFGSFLINEVVGPFKSEVDCEEFCNKTNQSISEIYV